jgi:hypothetical protein
MWHFLRNVGSYADHTALCPRRMVIVNDRCENPRSSSIVPRSDYWSVLMSSLSVSILRPQQWKPFLSSPYFPSVRANSLHSEPYECIGPTATFRHALLQPVVLWSCIGMQLVVWNYRGEHGRRVYENRALGNKALGNRVLEKTVLRAAS